MLNGVYYTIEAALPAMLENGDGGAIVITSSTAGLNGLCPQFSLHEPRRGRLSRRPSTASSA